MQRIAKGESSNSDVAVPERPAGQPRTFREHAELMFDLQALAFQADITRVSTFMMARENINRSYGEIGLPEVVGFTLTTNVASQRVLEKAGVVYERVLEHAGLPHWFGRLPLGD